MRFDFYQEVLATLEHPGELAGYLAACFTVATYSMRTMIPLRISGICANCLFITYGYLAAAYPNLLLHSILLPLNIVRLYQMIRLISQVKDASLGDLSMDWIKLFTRQRHCCKGEKIFAKGETADALFYLASGRYRLSELGLELAQGEIVGEMGLVTPENRRTQSFECIEDGTLLVMSYDQARQLYFQNPRFGFYFLRLISRRLLANNEQSEARLSHLLIPSGEPEAARLA
jgi:CRP-like cAMP-binding protein